MQKTTLFSIISLLENVTSKDPTRPPLTGVLITPTELVATDGHKMTVIEHKDSELTPLNKSYFVSPESKNSLKFILKSYKKYPAPITIMLVDGTSLTLQDLDKTTSLVIKDTASANVTYPNYKQLIPKQTDTIEVSFNPEYLLALAKSLTNEENKKNPAIKLKMQIVRTAAKDGPDKIALDLGPIVVTKQDASGMALLMPCRM